MEKRPVGTFLCFLSSPKEFYFIPQEINKIKFCFILTILSLPFCEIGLILLDTKIKSSDGVKLGPFVSLLSFDTKCVGEKAVSKLLT